jgi:type II secretory ATPase GspE/PulE/Tfp pilus assembly ATPase PilB-like protein
MQSHSKVLLGDLLLREGLLTQEHVTHACEVQRTLAPPLPYGEVCLRLGLLSPDALAAVLKKHPPRIPLGELLIHHGLVSANRVQLVLAHQRGATKQLGRLLVEKGWLSERDLFQTLQKQTLLAKQARGKFDALIYAGRLTHEEVEAATREAQSKRHPVEAVLLTKYHLSKQEIGYALSTFYQCPFVEYESGATLDAALVRNITRSYLTTNVWVPLRATPEWVEILIDDPRAFQKMQDIRRLSPNKEIRCAVGLRDDILSFITLAYTTLTTSSDPHSLTAIFDQLAAEGLGTAAEEESDAVAADDSAIVRLVNKMVQDAVRAGVSDIHVEPYGRKEDTVIRFRVDGQCFEYLKVPAAYRRALISRLKIMAGLDIAERRKPQDGKIKFPVGTRHVELRVVTIPTEGGESEDAVLRLLHTGDPLPLEHLHMAEWCFREFTRILQKPYGLILCAGPTGSGKTTTLHAALRTLNTEHKKIWTVEDPIEITQRGLRQVQVNTKIGFDFATALRSFFRADPDIMMIGEMRDQETAAIVLQAALTGHLVLSTIHTNSAAETVTRLLDMGLDPFNFADALLGILAQRLARRLCGQCKAPYHPAREEYDELAHWYGAEAFAKLQIPYDGRFMLYRTTGCEQCRQSGYKGRIGVHELLVVTPEVKRLIHRRATVEELLCAAVAYGMTTLGQDGVGKVLHGWTDLSQIKAVTMG